MRRLLVDQALTLITRAAGPRGQEALLALLGGMRPSDRLPDLAPTGDAPYWDLGRASDVTSPDRPREIFVTGRFRSGSTFLWNLFRQHPECRAFYEPFNERRWFDPRHRGERVDRSHRGVTDYWTEYEGLEALGRFYREDWTRRRLYMDERSWDGPMLDYVRALIASTTRRAVLQFNRIDFRLAWFRRFFPEAPIVHILRHARDQWISTLIDPGAFCPDRKFVDFRPADKFYLTRWIRDLRHTFPFLDEYPESHPYTHFYFVWRLSHLFGVRYADISVHFEEIVRDPVAQVNSLMARLGLSPLDPETIARVVQNPEFGKWRRYASEAWFIEQEERCETVIADFFKPAGGYPTRKPRSHEMAARQ